MDGIANATWELSGWTRNIKLRINGSRTVLKVCLNIRNKNTALLA
jgi:hypothetical protein